jgi:hypothetical protein
VKRTRVHHAARRRGGVAARGGRAAAWPDLSSWVLSPGRTRASNAAHDRPEGWSLSSHVGKTLVGETWEIDLSCSQVSGTPEFGMRFSLMSSDRVIVDAIKMAQHLLWQNLPPTRSLPDATTVMRCRDLVRSPAVQSTLERSSNTFPAFALRAVDRVLADQSRTDREIISRLWDVLDEALGLPQNSRIAFGPYPKRR